MTEPILDPAYWSQRHREAPAHTPHFAVFKGCSAEEWARIEEAHRKILAAHVRPSDGILDVGCGWGRLLDLLPPDWPGDRGWYMGIDLCPEFIEEAKRRYGTDSIRGRAVTFYCLDIRQMYFPPMTETAKADWAVCISIRPMWRRNVGEAKWDEVQACLFRVAKRILFLEYDEDDPGEVVEG